MKVGDTVMFQTKSTMFKRLNGLIGTLIKRGDGMYCIHPIESSYHIAKNPITIGADYSTLRNWIIPLSKLQKALL